MQRRYSLVKGASSSLASPYSSYLEKAMIKTGRLDELQAYESRWIISPGSLLAKTSH